MTTTIDEVRAIDPDAAARFEQQQAELNASVEEYARTAKVTAADNELSAAAQAKDEAIARHEAAVAAREALNPVVEEAPVEDIAEVAETPEQEAVEA